MSPLDDDILQRIHRDLMDSYDEEYELELEDRNLDELAGIDGASLTAADRDARRA